MLVAKRSFAAAAFCAALTVACNSPGHVKAVKTADRLEELRASVEDLQTRVAATSTALAGLVAKKDQDAATAFHQLESSVHALESAQRRVDGRLEGMRSEAEEYFVTWKEQAATIGDEDLKEQSEERRAELASAVEKVTGALVPAREAIDAYLATSRDTLKYLSIDLTPSGIASIDGRVKDASKTAKSIHSKLEDVLASVRAAAPMFARARATGAKKQLSGADVSSN